MSEAQGNEDRVAEQMFEAGFESSGKEIKDGDISDDMISERRSEMETAITNAADTPALETLYTYVNTADEGDPVVMERPLGELPRLES